MTDTLFTIFVASASVPYDCSVLGTGQQIFSDLIVSLEVIAKCIKQIFSILGTLVKQMIYRNKGISNNRQTVDQASAS